MNWYKIKYKDSNNHLKLKPNSEFSLEFKEISLNSKNYFEALTYNASLIADTYLQPFDVLLSGGIDSEVVVRIHKNLGIKQNVYTFKFEDDLNIRDVQSAKRICDNLNIPLILIDFDLKKFFESDAESLYKKTYTARVETLPRLAFHDYLDNIPIFADGEPYWKRRFLDDYSKKSEWTKFINEYDYVHNLYGIQQNRDVIGCWYAHSPDIFLQYYKDPFIKKLLNDEFKGKISNWSSKVNHHRELWKDIETKPKLVGYEGANGKPGEIPEFMEVFKNSIMQEVTNGVIELTIQDLESIQQGML